jgi:hypothetical protein
MARGTTPERLRELMQAQLSRWTKLARQANLQAVPQITLSD